VENDWLLITPEASIGSVVADSMLFTRVAGPEMVIAEGVVTTRATLKPEANVPVTRGRSSTVLVRVVSRLMWN
jgi:hypothetical protein